MATPAPTVLNAIDALFITLYNRVADYSDYVGFAGSLGLTYQQAAGTPATVAQFQTLAAQMTGPNNSAAVTAYYNTNYGSLTPSAFITALYTNLGGPTNQAGIAPGVTYWTGQILAAEAAGTPQATAYTNVLGQFVDAFLTYSGNDPAALQRQQTLNNKVAVSEFYAQASQTNSFLIPTAPSGPTFQAVQNIIANVTAAYSTVVAAEAEITAAVAQQSLAPILGTTFTLTGAIDTITTGAVGAIFNAPLVTSTLGIVNSNSLNPTDSIVDTNKDGTLNVSIGLLVGSTINDAVVPNVTLSGVSTANVTVIYDGGIGGLVPPPAVLQVGGFAGTITGLTTVNDVNSSETLQLGLSNDGLGTVLQNLNVSGFTATRGSPVFGVLLQAGLGSLSNTIHINLQDSVYGTNNSFALVGGPYAHTPAIAPGTYATAAITADTLAIGSDGAPGGIPGVTAANLSYGTWALTTKGSDFLQLTDNADILHGALYNTNVNAATAITLLGNGNVTLGTDVSGNWANLATIDASGATGGSVTINGAASGITSNAYGSLSLGGSAWGLLDGDTALTLFKGDPNGANWLDVSSESLAQIGKLTATGNTGFENTIVVTSLVADTTSTTTFAGVTNFQELAVGGPVFADGIGGTINMTNLPSTINDILYLTASKAGVTINNVVNALTVDAQDNGFFHSLTVTSVNPTTAGTQALLTISEGNTFNPLEVGTTAAHGDLGNVLLTGFTNIQFDAVGAIPSGIFPANTDNFGTVSLVPAPALGEHVTITGDSGIAFGYPFLGGIGPGGVQGSDGGIFDFAAVPPGAVNNLNDLVIHDTTAGATFLNVDLDPALGGFGVDPNFGASTNAFILDASLSGTNSTVGGLLMRGGDSNFIPTLGSGFTVATGDTITGSQTAGNIIIGSLGNDVLTGTLSLTQADTIGTDGGKDTINLAAGHTASDHIEFFDAIGTTTGGGINPPGSALTSFSSLGAVGGTIVGTGDVAQGGWWGAVYSLTNTKDPFLITGAATGADVSNPAQAGAGGTSVDNSTVNHFVAGAGGDVLDFSVSAWGKYQTPNGLLANGDTHWSFSDIAGDATSLIGNAVFANVTTGGTVVGPHNADVLVIGNGSFANAAALANTLAGTGAIGGAGFAPAAVGNEVHLLVAYQNLQGNTVIADLDLDAHATAGTTSTATGNLIAVSDIVTLTGVSLTQLTAGNIHFVA